MDLVKSESRGRLITSLYGLNTAGLVTGPVLGAVPGGRMLCPIPGRFRAGHSGSGEGIAGQQTAAGITAASGLIAS